MELYALAERFVGQVIEGAGTKHNPFIQWSLSLCGYDWDTPDEVPWCSAFINALAWLLRLPRSKSAAARSWLLVGRPIPWGEEVLGDVIVLKRGGGNQPGPEVIKAQGHVGVFAGHDGDAVLVLGGNQANSVSIQRFSQSQVLGIRRLV